MYQSCDPTDGETPVSDQSASSFLCVPLSSPLEANVAPEAAIFASAVETSDMPATPAGSSAGPTITKSLYATRVRLVTSPASNRTRSASGAWVSSTSALPSAPMRSAAPVPTAMILTLTSASSSKIGTSWSSSPESLSEVVVARISSSSLKPWSEPQATAMTAAANRVSANRPSSGARLIIPPEWPVTRYSPEVIIPAPTVAEVASSIRMKAPVSRDSAYGSMDKGAMSRSRTRPISLSESCDAVRS